MDTLAPMRVRLRPLAFLVPVLLALATAPLGHSQGGELILDDGRSSEADYVIRARIDEAEELSLIHI